MAPVAGAGPPRIERPVLPHDPAQAVTVERIERLGEALLAWYTDVVSAGWPVGEIDVRELERMSAEDLAERLEPLYVEELSLEDGWGHELEVFVPSTPGGLIGQGPLMLIRSPGADRRFDGWRYRRGSFSDPLADSDVVWVDGFFLRWPASKTGKLRVMPRSEPDGHSPREDS